MTIMSFQFGPRHFCTAARAREMGYARWVKGALVSVPNPKIATRAAPSRKAPAPTPAPRRFDKLTPVPHGDPRPLHVRGVQSLMMERDILAEWLKENAGKHLSIGDQIRREIVEHKIDELRTWEGWSR